MIINKIKNNLLDEFDFSFNEWEFDEFHRRVGNKFRLRLFEISNGDPSFVLALSLLRKSSMGGVLSIDPVNSSEIGSDMYVRKRLAFSTIHANGCLKTESLEVDAIDDAISEKVMSYFDGGKKPLVSIVNYVNNSLYTNNVLNCYKDFISEGLIVFNSLYCNGEWEGIFKDFSKDKKSMIVNGGQGLGIIFPD